MMFILKKLRVATIGAAALTAAMTPVPARIIAMNQPALAVTADRISALPAKERAPWRAYLARSQAQMRADKAALAAERTPGMPIPPQPATGNGEQTMPLTREPAWYASPEARHIADVILSFQTPAGGWGKNQPRDGAVRQPGQLYISNNSNTAARPGDFDAPGAWHYVGTIDNDATIIEIRFLARVAAATPGAAGDGIGWARFAACAICSPHNIRTAARHRCGRSKAVITTRSR